METDSEQQLDLGRDAFCHQLSSTIFSKKIMNDVTKECDVKDSIGGGNISSLRLPVT